MQFVAFNMLVSLLESLFIYCQLDNHEERVNLHILNGGLVVHAI